MTHQLLNIVIGLTGFLLFVIVQALVINGIKASMDENMILEKPAGWIKKKLGATLSKPIVGCIRCFSSFYGGLMYWPTAIYLFGFNLWQVPVFIADAFILVTVSWYFYKKL